MPRGRSTFRQRDVTAAIKAVKAAGESVARVEVEPDGKMMVIIGAPDRAEPGVNEADIEDFRNVLRRKKQARPGKGPPA